MSKDLNVYVERGNADYFTLAAYIGTPVTDVKKADIIMFTGGADVSPSLYGEQKIPKTYNDPQRDAIEVSIYQRMRADKSRNRAFIGICRGGQLLNVLNGGRLWQHVEDHGRDHPVWDIEGKVMYKCSSTHHQQFRTPVESNKVPYTILAYALDKNGRKLVETSKFAHKVQGQELVHDAVDIEAMWYPRTSSLCFQPHPEYPGYPECLNLFMKYVNKYIIPSLNSEKKVAE